MLPVKCLLLVLLLRSPFHLHLPIFLQLSAALGCRTNTAWVLSQECRVMPRQRPLVPDGSSWILPLRYPPCSAAFSFSSAGSHNLLPFSQMQQAWHNALGKCTEYHDHPRMSALCGVIYAQFPCACLFQFSLHVRETKFAQCSFAQTRVLGLAKMQTAGCMLVSGGA